MNNIQTLQNQIDQALVTLQNLPSGRFWLTSLPSLELPQAVLVFFPATAVYSQGKRPSDLNSLKTILPLVP
ncbi:hypothetical protein [Microseira wollei]|uniref:hypothetical protein n=1 Tax=Microseira wollei TaxID=467598 RepID=UPI001CFF42B3|nr:hypothetical protein [Microseira wollei]